MISHLFKEQYTEEELNLLKINLNHANQNQIGIRTFPCKDNFAEKSKNNIVPKKKKATIKRKKTRSY